MVTERGSESGSCVRLPLTHGVNPDKASPLWACLCGGADQQVWLWELDLGMARAGGSLCPTCLSPGTPSACRNKGQPLQQH